MKYFFERNKYKKKFIFLTFVCFLFKRKNKKKQAYIQSLTLITLFLSVFSNNLTAQNKK